jgi:hypothetical protein
MNIDDRISTVAQREGTLRSGETWKFKILPERHLHFTRRAQGGGVGMGGMDEVKCVYEWLTFKFNNFFTLSQ